MDERYLAGKIYQISCDETQDVYVGSTIKTLENRMSVHRSAYKSYINGSGKYCKSCELLQYSTARIKLILNYPCNSKTELCKREGEIQLQTANCINRKIAGRKLKEWYEENRYKINEYQKQYRQDNLEKIKKYEKQHYEENKEHIKQWREDNREKIKEKRKQYYQDNRERISEKKKLKRAKKRAAKLEDN